MIASHRIAATTDIRDRRLAGLALNPAAPEDVLLRLLSDGPTGRRWRA
ncbi:hypothetical protein ACIP9H_23875 [Streptomyces sp. NPDC088732]